jgi:caffeoyl-CoA O-methyltransferase
MEMTPERWEHTGAYSKEVFGTEDDHLAGLMEEAVAAGLPNISVGADVGRLLMILTSLTPGRLAVEVGTLGGYSGIWIARGLSPGGRLITIEFSDKHADFAEEQFIRADVDDRVEVRRGSGIDLLRELVSELAPESVDVLFLDAIKSEYTKYIEIARPLIARGGLVLADNVYGTGHGWIDEGHGTDRFNRLIASDDEFEAVAVPMREGVLVARRRE